VPLSLHRIRLSFGPSTYIEIENAKGAGKTLDVPPPIPFLELCERETENDARTALSVPAMCWRADVPVLFEKLQFVRIPVKWGTDSGEAGQSRTKRRWLSL
jgi:hypothetical protein